MKEKSAELARGWIEAWKRFDMDWLRKHLASNFVHISPFGRFDDRETYLTAIEPMARKSVMELVIIDTIADARPGGHPLRKPDSKGSRRILRLDSRQRRCYSGDPVLLRYGENPRDSLLDT